MTITGEKIQNFEAQPHVLVVDDDLRILELVSRYLREHGFLVLTAQSASQARALLERFSVDAMVVDVMMPGETGLELTQSIAQENIPVLLLTALGEAQDRITGLEAGADDYLPKPFEPKELVLRLQAILRRTQTLQKIKERSFKIGRWTFDPQIEALRDGDEAVKLTAMEINLIKALASRPGEAFSREALGEMCEIEAGARTIDVQVTRLRRKIEEDTKLPRYLQTVRGKGYLLRIEEL